MKSINNKYYLIIVALVGLLFGCTKLDEEVYDTVPFDQFGTNDKQIAAIIAPIYGSLQLYFPGAPWQLAETSSDMSVIPTRKGGDWWGGGQWKQIETHTWTPNTATINGVYSRLTSGVATCNQIYHTINTSNAAFPNKEQVLAEIRGVRAFWYYQLLDFFGNVPIATDFTDTELPTNSSRKDVYAFVLSELNAIKDIVRSDVSVSSYGKITKGAVYTILAKMYLNAMVWNPDGGPKWQDAADACDMVMSLNYRLEPDWRLNFAVRNETSREIILPAVFSRSSGSNNISQQSLHYLDPIALGLKVNAFNGISAMPGYYKSFDPADKRLARSFLIGPMKDPTTGNTLITAHGRQLIHTPEITMVYGIDADGWGQTEQEDGARVFKWEIENNLSTPAQENDYAIFRLADVYLMKAEALVRLNKDNAIATQLVNSIRARGFDDPSKMKSSVTLEDVYNERRFELAWEGFGRQDQIRFGTFLNAIPGWKPARNNPNLLLFPLPQSALNANPKLKQNPGY